LIKQVRDQMSDHLPVVTTVVTTTVDSIPLTQLDRRPEARQSWRTFLANHREVVAAMDFFTVATASFRILYVRFVIEQKRRHVVHFNVTEHPSAAWVIPRLREAFPYDASPPPPSSSLHAPIRPASINISPSTILLMHILPC
jgi:transposase InsO family protein